MDVKDTDLGHCRKYPLNCWCHLGVEEHTGQARGMRVLSSFLAALGTGPEFFLFSVSVMQLGQIGVLLKSTFG